MSLFAYVLVFFAGVIVPLQALVDARLAHLTSGPAFASLLSSCVGTVALASWWLATRPVLPDFAAFRGCRGGHGAAACWVRFM